MTGINEKKAVDAADLRHMSGLEFVQAMIDGRLAPPPMAETLSFRLLEVEHGRAVFTGEPAKRFYNPIGSVHGGWAATLLDSCMGCAVQTTLPAGTGYTTLEFKIDLLRPITVETGAVRAEGNIVKSGRRIALANGALYDDQGRLLARGTTTCLVFAYPDGESKTSN
jgi:uncharacterized protein (TIGR00369 family)